MHRRNDKARHFAVNPLEVLQPRRNFLYAGWLGVRDSHSGFAAMRGCDSGFEK